jgi:hypothetical protein
VKAEAGFNLATAFSASSINKSHLMAVQESCDLTVSTKSESSLVAASQFLQFWLLLKRFFLIARRDLSLYYLQVQYKSRELLLSY